MIDVPTCRVCGCTDEWGCDEGCSWVEPDLCSACVGADPEAPEPPLDLGACCVCGQPGPTVYNVVLLSRRAPIPGTGWGCVVCHLPMDGAVAVVCDACRETPDKIGHVCHGYPGDGRRMALTDLLAEPFDHDPLAHAEWDTIEGPVRHG